MFKTRWLLPLLALPFTACGDKTEDTGNASEYASISGTVTYTVTENGTAICDAISTFDGTPYTGACKGCDFAFSVDGSYTSNNSTEDCYLWPTNTLVPDEYVYDLILAGGAKVKYEGWYGSYDLNNALLVGYSMYFYGTSYPGPYWYPLAYDDSYYDWTFTRNGPNLSWGYTSSYSYDSFHFNQPYYTYCDYFYGSYAYYAYPGSATGDGEVDCSGSQGDVWTFQATAGEIVSVTVDTVDAATAFDPAFLVNDPSGCTIMSTDDNFDCTFPPPTYWCPTAQFEATTAGAYEVTVFSRGDCAGSTSKYQIQVQAANARLQSTKDNVDIGTVDTVNLETTLTAQAKME